MIWHLTLSCYPSLFCSNGSVPAEYDSFVWRWVGAVPVDTANTQLGLSLWCRGYAHKDFTVKCLNGRRDSTYSKHTFLLHKHTSAIWISGFNFQYCSFKTNSTLSKVEIRDIFFHHLEWRLHKQVPTVFSNHVALTNSNALNHSFSKTAAMNPSVFYYWWMAGQAEWQFPFFFLL